MKPSKNSNTSTPTRKRRTRVDSLSQTVKIVQSSFKDIEPPAFMPLQTHEMPFWEAVVAEMPKSAWTDHKLGLAVFLSRSMAALEECYRALSTEGSVIEIKNKGGEVVDYKSNPRMRFIDIHQRQILSYRRSLGIQARALEGEARDMARRMQHAQALEDALLDDDDGLLARPTNYPT